MSQTCVSTLPETTPDSRFTTQNSGTTVLDTRTTMEWKRCSEGQSWNSTSNTCTGSNSTFNWMAAQTQVDTVNTASFAGYSDWRLPNSEELRSIVEFQCYSPAMNATIFPNITSTTYWSSSPYAFKVAGNAAGTKDIALFIDFDSGEDGFDNKDALKSVRLVRGG